MGVLLEYITDIPHPVKTYFKTSKKSHRFHTFPAIPAVFFIHMVKYLLIFC